MIKIQNFKETSIEVPLSKIPALINLILFISIISYSVGKSKVGSVP